MKTKENREILERMAQKFAKKMNELMDEIQEEAEEEESESKCITIPDNIRIIKDPSNTFSLEDGDSLYLISPNNKCIMSAIIENGGIPWVGCYNGVPNNQIFFLKPCNRKDLKCGDIAFRVDKPNRTEEQCLYCVILNDHECAYWRNEGDMDMMIDDEEWPLWYKVVER